MQPETMTEPAPTLAPPSNRLGRQVKRVVTIVVGFTLIAIGGFFGLVPLIPGWPLGLLGLSMLAAEFVWAKRLMARVHQGATRLREVFFPRTTKRRARRKARKDKLTDLDGSGPAGR